jgi:hypothetical protein
MSISQVKNIALPPIHLVIAVFFALGAGLLHAQNLVPNGGFESSFSGWSNNTSGGASASFSVETSQPYAGAKAMKVVINNPGIDLHNVQTLGPTFRPT